MSTVAVTPILSEFGSLVVDAQPRVRRWLQGQDATRKVVFAPKAYAPLFEEATEVIDLPPDLLPTVPAVMRSVAPEHWRAGDPQRERIERLVEWARSQVDADAWLDVPYFTAGPWAAPATFTRLASDRVTPQEPYVVLAEPSPSATQWAELTRRVEGEWGLGVRRIGLPSATGDDLAQSIALLNNAVCSVGGHSGLTHLSLMSGCPTFAWGDPAAGSSVEHYTNPLKTPCTFLPAGHAPDVERVWNDLCAWRRHLDDDRVRGRYTGGRTTLSMCMIARQSAGTIKAALDGVGPWVDEMIVVDTGSTDGTQDVARACGATVVQSDWPDSFAVARNESLRHAAGQWVFWMDSDDTITPENGRKLKDLVRAARKPSVMGFVARVRCPNAPAGGSYATATLVDHIKVIRNLPAIAFTGRIHEQVLPSIRALGGDVEWTNVRVDHSGSDQSPQGRAGKQQRDIRLLQLQTQDEPDSTFAWFNVGMTLLDMGRPEAALDPLSRALQLSVPAESHVRKVHALLAQAYYELGRPATAMHACLQGLHDYPGDPELTFRKGILEQAQGRPDLAEVSFLSVVRTPSARHFASIDAGILGVKGWHNLAVVYETQQKYDDAADAWRRVLGLDATNPTAWAGLIDATDKTGGDLPGTLTALGPIVPVGALRLAEAKAATRVGDIQGALDGLKETLSEEKTEYSEILLDELVRVAIGYNRPDDACEALSDAVRGDPQNASALHNLAVLCLQQQDYDRAIEYAKASLSARPDSQSTRRVLESAYALAGSHRPEPAEAVH